MAHELALARCEAIFFDLGNTLIYFDDNWPMIMSNAYEELWHSLGRGGYNLDPSFVGLFRGRMMDYFRERDSEFIEHTSFYILQSTLSEYGYEGIPEPALRQALVDLYQVTQVHWLPDPEALPVVKIMHERGYRLGLISNAADDANTQALVDKVGIRPYMEVVLSSAQAGVRKPNPRIFLQALQTLKLPADRAVMVGDTLGADILGAKNVGCLSIWVTQWADAPDNLAHRDTIHPDLTLQRLGQLLDLFPLK